MQLKYFLLCSKFIQLHHPYFFFFCIYAKDGGEKIGKVKLSEERISRERERENVSANEAE